MSVTPASLARRHPKALATFPSSMLIRHEGAARRLVERLIVVIEKVLWPFLVTKGAEAAKQGRALHSVIAASRCLMIARARSPVGVPVGVGCRRTFVAARSCTTVMAYLHSGVFAAICRHAAGEQFP
jgi:hypothetical protein